VQYLENEIAALERGTPSIPAPSSNASHSSGNASSTSIPDRGAGALATTFIDLIVQDFTPSFLGLSEEVPLARFVVTGTRIPSAKKSFGASDIDDRHPRSIVNPVPASAPLHSIPVKVADFLFGNYVSRILPQYPIFYEPEIVSLYNSVFHNPAPGCEPGARATAHGVYVTSLIMAISLSTAARTKQARANNIAFVLFKSSVQQASAVFTNDTRGLQALLLLLQYTFLNPSAANLWFLSGFVIQACIDLGLHRELPEELHEDALVRDMRRRLFWCAYEMDVAVCAGLLRPLGILNKHISVSFPTEYEDSAVSACGIDTTGRITKFSSTRIWTFRQIESEIISILFQGEPLPFSYPSVEDWLEGTENSIQRWNQEVHQSASLNTDPTRSAQWSEMSLYADIAYAYIIVTLFRPCPRIKSPTSENLIKAFVAAVKVADGYWQQSNSEFGSIKYVFHPCHHAFSSATVFLHALQGCKATIASSYTLDEVERFMESFPRFFTTIAERWPAASRCLEEYERLLAPIKKEYIEYTLQKDNFDWPTPSNLDEFDGIQRDLMDSAASLDDMAYFSTLFDFNGLVEASETFGPPTALPNDWNAEFDFGMQETLWRNGRGSVWHRNEY